MVMVVKERRGKAKSEIVVIAAEKRGDIYNYNHSFA